MIIATIAVWVVLQRASANVMISISEKFIRIKLNPITSGTARIINPTDFFTYLLNVGYEIILFLYEDRPEDLAHSSCTYLQFL